MQYATWLVTIQDLRPRLEGKIYRKSLRAQTRSDAINDIVLWFATNQQLYEGCDYHIVGAQKDHAREYMA